MAARAVPQEQEMGNLSRMHSTDDTQHILPRLPQPVREV
ncbi:hypothetical protein J2809_003929 [Arthrobacter pascens]|nr:hypothetical protein [Arthrobacter pascens]